MDPERSLVARFAEMRASHLRSYPPGLRKSRWRISGDVWRSIATASGHPNAKVMVITGWLVVRDPALPPNSIILEATPDA